MGPLTIMAIWLCVIQLSLCLIWLKGSWWWLGAQCICSKIIERCRVWRWKGWHCQQAGIPCRSGETGWRGQATKQVSAQVCCVVCMYVRVCWNNRICGFSNSAPWTCLHASIAYIVYLFILQSHDRCNLLFGFGSQYARFHRIWRSFLYNMRLSLRL